MPDYALAAEKVTGKSISILIELTQGCRDVLSNEHDHIVSLMESVSSMRKEGVRIDKFRQVDGVRLELEFENSFESKQEK